MSIYPDLQISYMNNTAELVEKEAIIDIWKSLGLDNDSHFEWEREMFYCVTETAIYLATKPNHE